MNNWTPTNEKLPEHGQEVLIAVKWRRNAKKFDYFHAWFMQEEIDEEPWFDTEGTKAIDIRVVKAWMPIPKFEEE